MYEQIFYDRLKCNSPVKVSDLLKRALNTVREPINELRVLDLGAGNGMMGEALKRDGVARLVGADIIPEACDAAYRDRSEVYDDYYVADFAKLDADMLEELREWSFDCLTCVAALGFGDIPPRAFFSAMKLVRTDGWLAFNIKETFLDHNEHGVFASRPGIDLFKVPGHLPSRTLPPPSFNGRHAAFLLRLVRAHDRVDPRDLSRRTRHRGLGTAV